LAGYLLKSNKRKTVLMAFHGTCLIICLIFAHVTNPLISSLLLFFNCFCISANFVNSYVFAAEVFDSKIKGSANGLLLIVSSTSLIFGDYFMDLLPSPYYLFAILSGLTILSISQMVETMNLE
jgi:hypothetical protein